MTDTIVTSRPPQGAEPGWGVRLVRGVGWTLIATGAFILLYLVYLLFFTNLETQRAQNELLDQWELEIGAPEVALPAEDPVQDGPADPVSPGDAYAAMWFERDGQRVIHDDTLFVVEGVEVGDLRSGPGHYADSAAPGENGNFAVAGHRTTYGAPFYHLDQLQAGDEIHVVDRANRHWVYAFREQRIVSPGDVWVVGDDPLDTDTPLLTLTTCHPRTSAAQRLIVFADLVTDPDDGLSQAQEGES